MSEKALEAARLIEMLPEDDQNFAFEFIKKLVRAWDPDFTKLTAEEARCLEKAENSGFVNEEDIDWSTIGQ